MIIIIFFLTLCFITKFCVLASNYLNAYKQLLFILTVAYEMPPPPQKFCCVFKFYWLSDEDIKHWFNLYFN